MKTHKSNFLRDFKFEYRITLTYILFGFIWILFSDKVLDFLTADDSLLTEFQTFKGSFFIIITSGFLYVFVRKHMQSLRIIESHLIESEERYRFMFYNNPQPNWIYDIETLAFLEVNEAAIIHYGYSKDEFLSMTLKDIRPAEDIPSLLEDVQRTRNPFNNSGEWRHIKKNGELIFVEIISHSVIFNGRDARHVLLHDITDRKQAEEALKKAANELESLHNHIDAAVFSVDVVHNKMLYASIAHQTVFGYSPDEFFKNPQLWYELIIDEDKPIVDAGFPVLLSGKNLRHEVRIIQPDGQMRWIEAKMNPTLDANGKLIRVDGIATNINDRKQIEIELLESEINFRRSISESPVGIRIVSVDGETIYANKAFLDIYEFSSLQEFTDTPAKNRYTPESYVQHQERKEKRRNGEEVFDYEISIIGKNEEIRHIKVSRKEVLWNGIQHFQIINLNITEQRNAEEQLRKLSRAVEQSPDAICISNPDGIIEYVNPRTIELTGFSIEEMLGYKTNIFSSGETPAEVYAQLWQTIKSGNVWSGELHNKKKNGELYWESITISPIFDKEGQTTHFLSIKEDVTERKRAEIALNNSEEQLRKFASHLQNVREEEKVALAREIHDDLGQILVALKIDMGLLKQKMIKNDSFVGSKEMPDKFDSLVFLIDKTITTARRIMNGLRPELLEMHGFVGASKEYLREFEERHHLICEFKTEISNLEINQQQTLAFFRILQEAMTNIAKHAKASLVKIQLSIEADLLMLRITDNGIGFDKNNSGRQDSYGMIGMKERVILLGGTLDISSEVGLGTSVSVAIPYFSK
ncbi:MAG: PAS domain S-box protein [Paludibacter sp.]